MQSTFDAKGQGMNLLVSRVRHSHLVIWLALIAPSLRHSSYNRHRLFLMQLFDFAVTEKIIEKSPFDAEIQVVLPGRRHRDTINRDRIHRAPAGCQRDDSPPHLE
ncbi:MAG: hypothetical protein ABIZ56_08765 [Chthoniobacteraceae bacterium]